MSEGRFSGSKRTKKKQKKKQKKQKKRSRGRRHGKMTGGSGAVTSAQKTSLKEKLDALEADIVELQAIESLNDDGQRLLDALHETQENLREVIALLG
jgi:hypothetical protein